MYHFYNFVTDINGVGKGRKITMKYVDFVVITLLGELFYSKIFKLWNNK